MALTPMPFDPLLERLRQATRGLYEIRDELGRGGMAVVYMAKDLRLHRPVAIKVMQPALLHADGMTDRFLQEARIAAQLQHPNIIIVHDVQQQDDLLYFVMNLVEGATVDEMMRASPFTIPQVRWILSSAARGLAHAHSEGVVHRDVKPGNLLVNVKGDVIVTDFGIAKGVDSVRMTQTGMAIGTPVYMSPEQVTGATAVSSASDQYSLGIAAYEMLAGAPPFTGDSAFALQVAHVQREPADLISRRPDCPPDLAFIVHRMIAKSPEQRWSSLDEVSALAAAALPFGGGDARKELAVTARRIHDGRGLSTAAFGVRTPRSPVPKSQAPKAPTSGSVTALVLNPHESHLTVSGKIRLHSLAMVNGQDSGEHRARWMSTDPNVAVVTDDGEVMGIGAGRAEIIAVNQFGEARATIEVVNAPAPSVAVLDTPVPVVVPAATPVPVAPKVDTPAPVIRVMSVDITPSRAVMEGGEVIPLTVKVRDMRGALVAEPVVEWHSSEPLVAWVDDRGTVAALASGRATISATVDGVTSRATIEVGSTWKTVNSLEQLAVNRPTPVPVATPISEEVPSAPDVVAWAEAPVETPVAAPVAASIEAPIVVPAPVSSDATPTPAAIPVAPPLIDALVAPKREATTQPAVEAPVVARAASPQATVESSKQPSSSRSRVLIGGGVALVAIVAAVVKFMSGNAPATTAADTTKATIDIGAAPAEKPKVDSPRVAAAVDTAPVQQKTVATPPVANVASKSATTPTPAPAKGPQTPAKPPVGQSELVAHPQPQGVSSPTKSAASTTASTADTAVAKNAELVKQVVEKPAAPPPTPPANSGPPATSSEAVKSSANTEASVASAVRDLRAQLQRKEVRVGQLDAFFKLGSAHELVSVGQPHSIISSEGSVTAVVPIEIKRSAPSGNIERRTSQITFKVLGSGESARAQVINASSLQKP